MKKIALDVLRSIKWFFTELVNMYSNNPSFFSKKRVESGIAFFISQWGMVHWLSAKYNIMTTSDFAMWAGIELAAAGYIINQIQKEKKETYESTTEQNNANQ
jgi:hypothetical protein